MSFAPPRNSQYDPATSTSARDCVAAVTAMLVERATVGRIRSNHGHIRALSGAPSTRGLYLREGQQAAKALGVTLEVALGVSRNTLRDTVRTGQAAGVTGHTSETRYTTRRTNYYVGPHEIYVNDYSYWPDGETCDCELRTSAAHGEFTVEDPGTTSVGYLQWSAGLVYRFAEKLTAMYGLTGINLLVAPDTEGVTRISQGATLYDSPYRSSPKKGTSTKGHKVTVTSTYNGGGWPRADGSTAYGWHRVPGDLYATGRSLR